MKSLKRIIALVLTLCLVASVPVNSSTYKYYSPEMLAKEKAPIKKVFSLEKPLNVQVYRSTEAALIEWDAVEGAVSYKIYRKETGKKYVYLGKVKEKYFIGTLNYKNTRFFVDIKYKKSKVKKYNYKKKYTYKVVAVNRKVQASSIIVSKKWKKKKAEPSYYTLYLINKKRVKAKKAPLYWGHNYEKGCKIRVKEITKKFSHDRPKKNYWGNGCDTAFMYLRLFDPWELSFYNLGIIGENIGYSSAGTEDIIYDGYWNSPGHKAIFMYNGLGEVADSSYYLQSNDARIFTEKGGNDSRKTYSLTAYTYSDNIAKQDELVYHQMVIGQDEMVVAKNYGKVHTAESRQKKDESVMLPEYLYEDYPYIIPLPIFYDTKEYGNLEKAFNDIFYEAGLGWNTDLWLNHIDLSYNSSIKKSDIDWDWLHEIKKTFYLFHGLNIDALN